MKLRAPRIASVTAAAVLAGVLLAAPLGTPESAAAGSPSWNGTYDVQLFAATKTGTSRAARQAEPNQSAVKTYSSRCTLFGCTATVTSSNPPSKSNVPSPAIYNWNGRAWVRTFNWNWDCYRGPNQPIEWAKASSRNVFTPQPNGTLTGVFETTIHSGYCKGTVRMTQLATRIS